MSTERHYYVQASDQHRCDRCARPWEHPIHLPPGDVNARQDGVDASFDEARAERQLLKAAGALPPGAA